MHRFRSPHPLHMHPRLRPGRPATARTKTRQSPAPDNNASAEDILEAVNNASSVARNIYITVLGFSLFLALVTGGLSDEKLLANSFVALPLVEKVDLPLSTFYALAPWLLVLLHGDMLLNFALLAEKLHRLNTWLHKIEALVPDSPVTTDLRSRLANFPFSHWIAGNPNYRLISGLIMGCTVVCLPPIVLLSAQVGFLPFQSEAITWGQRLAILADLILIIAFWPSLVGSTLDDGWWSWWLRAARHRIGSPLRLLSRLARRPAEPVKDIARGFIRLFTWTAAMLTLSFGVISFPGEWLEEQLLLPAFAAAGQTLELDPDSQWDFAEAITRTCYFGPLAYRIQVGHLSLGAANDTVLLPPKLTVTCPTALLFHRQWFWDWHRTLNVSEKGLDANGRLKPEITAKLRSSDTKTRREALDTIDPLDLRGRNLRFAILDSTVLPKVDLRGAKLDHASLRDSYLQEARADNNSHFQYADFSGANLTDARFAGANLRMSRFLRTDLTRANFRNTHSAGADLSWASLHDVDLTRANFQGATLEGAHLHGAKLDSVNLQGANLRGAQLLGATLDFVDLSGADLRRAALDGANLDRVTMVGVSLGEASLKGAILHQVEFDLNPVEGASFGKLNLREVNRTVTFWKEVYRDAKWLPQLRKTLETRIGKTQAPPQLKRCISRSDSRCDKLHQLEYAVVLGVLRGGLACSAERTAAAEAIARQGIRLLEEAKNSNNCIEPSRQAYSQALARELTRPDCTGRKTLSSAEKKLVSDWAKGGSEICRKPPSA